MLSSLLGRLAWYRRLRGGHWVYFNDCWRRITPVIPIDIEFEIVEDDLSLHPDVRRLHNEKQS